MKREKTLCPGGKIWYHRSRKRRGREAFPGGMNRKGGIHTMKIEISIEGLKNAEKFSSICQDYPSQLYLRSGQFCVDPKSMLGVLAIFYSASDPVFVDTGEMDEETLKKFAKDIAAYTKK